MTRLILALALALLFSACDKSQQTPDAQPAVATSSTAEEPVEPAAITKTKVAYELPPGLAPGEDVTRHDDLVTDKPRDHWIGVWGPSDQQLTFHVKDGPLEYQIELLNVFKEDDPETQKVEIHEDTWDEDGYTFILWSFRKAPNADWIAVQAMSYSDDIEF